MLPAPLDVARVDLSQELCSFASVWGWVRDGEMCGRRLPCGTPGRGLTVCLLCARAHAFMCTARQPASGEQGWLCRLHRRPRVRARQGAGALACLDSRAPAEQASLGSAVCAHGRRASCCAARGDGWRAVAVDGWLGQVDADAFVALPENADAEFETELKVFSPRSPVLARASRIAHDPGGLWWVHMPVCQSTCRYAKAAGAHAGMPKRGGFVTGPGALSAGGAACLLGRFSSG